MLHLSIHFYLVYGGKRMTKSCIVFRPTIPWMDYSTNAAVWMDSWSMASWDSEFCPILIEIARVILFDFSCGFSESVGVKL